MDIKKPSGISEESPDGRKKPGKVAHGWKPVGGVAGNPKGSFVAQCIDDLLSISTGLHEVNCVSVDLATDLDAEIAVGGDLAVRFLFGGRDTVHVGLAGHFDFHVVTGDGSECLAVTQGERGHEMLGIDTDIQADAIAVHDRVMCARAQRNAFASSFLTQSPKR